MKLVECPHCGHKNHPVKGKPRAFRYVDKLLKYLNCGRCKKLFTIESIEDGPWKSVKLERKKNAN